MNTMQALPSVYRGVHFRSRLEARWAIYFDLIGCKWQYEPEGYDLPSGNYCPDFWCEDNFFAEVKPTIEEAPEAIVKLVDLVGLSGHGAFLLTGNPSTKTQLAYHKNDDGVGEECFFPAIFCHYAFTYKHWYCPYFGVEIDDEISEWYAHIATNARFNNGICDMDLLRCYLGYGKK